MWTNESGSPRWSTSPGPYLGVQQVCVHHGPLDVVQVGVVLQRPLQEARLLAQLGHVGAVVVGEHLVAQDGVGDLSEDMGVEIHRSEKTTSTPVPLLNGPIGHTPPLLRE